MKNFVHHVSILPVESQEKIVVLLMDRIKAKFGLKTVSVSSSINREYPIDPFIMICFTK